MSKRDDDGARATIMARRQFFITSALAGVALSCDQGCDSPHVCLKQAIPPSPSQPPAPSATVSETPPSATATTTATPPEPSASATASTPKAPPPRAPEVCLEMPPATPPKPRPPPPRIEPGICLYMHHAPDDDDDDELG